ncbi:MAG: DUF1800 family protein [Gammaproteobacteria bacterium]|nr:DUF1800 family protein [Gammaproteobacteria bacterium]
MMVARFLTTSLLASVFLLGVQPAFAQTFYEDAESGAEHWVVYDNNPEGATVSTVYDSALQSQVIVTAGDGRRNGYRIGGLNTNNGWNNTTEFHVNWKMAIGESYTVYWRVDTTDGWRYIYYNHSNSDSLLHSNGRYVHHGLGSDTRDNRWRTYSRDLNADLKDAEPNNEVLAVHGFLVRGSGRFDDVILSNNASPMADIALGDRTVDLNSEFTLDGTGSYDPDGAITGYEWRNGEGVIVGTESTYRATPDATGDFHYLLTVTDVTGLTAATAMTLTVIDTTIPTVYEDAEDGNIDGWTIYDNTPTGGTITNEFDADSDSRVITVAGTDQKNGFMLGHYRRAESWLNTSQRTIRFRMRTDGNFAIYVRLHTTDGYRYLKYDQYETDRLGTGRTVHHALGAALKNGEWHSVVRNLDADLQAAQPDIDILEVRGFFFRGSGSVDDIELLNIIDEPPVANLVANPETGMLPLTVTLDATGSTDDIGIASYSFDIGVGDPIANTDGTTEFEFTEPGEFTATVTVTDVGGHTHTASQVITVLPDTELPIASVTASTLSGPLPLEVEFDSEGSSDNDSIADYHWDFGDGTTVSGAELLAPTHIFTTAGVFEVTLTVMDPSGNPAQSTLEIDVQTPPDPPPTASFLATAGTGANSLTVMVDASASSDNEAIVSYEWDFGDNYTGSGITSAVTYAEAGSKTIQLTVTDNANQSTTASYTISVTEPIIETPPTAVVMASPLSGPAPLQVSLNAADSTAADDATIVSYLWEIGDVTSSDEIAAEHTFASPGSYLVSLTVTDSNNLTDTQSVTIVVEEPTATAVSAEAAARLLTQATFGPTMDSIADVQAVGIESWIDQQLSLLGPPHLEYVQQHSNGSFKPPRHEIWWMDAVDGDDQLRQRVAFALSEIFVLSDIGSTLGNSQYGITQYYDQLRENAFGTYRELIEDVTLSPVMGLYLSMLQNAKGDPDGNTRADENYAREVMQLFSIGPHQLNLNGTPVLADGLPIPAYSQADVEELARVFTGWNYAGVSRWAQGISTGNNLIDPMEPYPGYHDEGSKTIVGGIVIPAGQTPDKDLSDALDALTNHPNTAPFISRQLIQRLITSNPTPAYVGRVAAVFDNNGVGERGDLAAVVKAILMDEEARTGHLTVPNFGKLREPLLRLSHLWRAFNITPGARSARGEYNTVSPHVEHIDDLTGQAPLNASSVFNFFRPDFAPSGSVNDASLVAPEAEIYIDSYIATTTTRINAQIQRFYASTPYDNSLNYSVLDLATENALAADPEALLERLDLLLLSGAMSDGLKNALLDHLDTLPDTDVGRGQRARDAISLIMASPEYLVQM